MHLFDSVHSCGCDQAHLHMPKAIPDFESALCKDGIQL